MQCPPLKTHYTLEKCMSAVKVKGCQRCCQNKLETELNFWTDCTHTQTSRKRLIPNLNVNHAFETLTSNGKVSLLEELCVKAVHHVSVCHQVKKSNLMSVSVAHLTVITVFIFLFIWRPICLLNRHSTWHYFLIGLV